MLLQLSVRPSLRGPVRFQPRLLQPWLRDVGHSLHGDCFPEGEEGRKTPEAVPQCL